ncbi:MAG TPA: trypsin-like peptidase domain-containing protein [Acidimicrobiales bacterium]|jgi:serine protease Do|nr:trypsin-like peptidase domain-containing protein [Acidimicrobiales bacterium]
MAVVEEVEQAVAQVARAAGASVVRIGRDGGRGAGVVVRDGFVVTSAHNLRGPSVTVTFAGGRVEQGEVRAADIEGDLAVVAVDTAGAPAIEWQPAAPRMGQVVFAVAPGRGEGARVTAGQVSTLDAAFRGPRGRLIPNGFEHTALVGRGSSGGPVTDGDGRLVGINTHRPGDGLYLALPADSTLAERVDALAAGQAPERRRLGVALIPGHVARRLRAAVGLPPRDGLLVRDVEAGGPADAAGIAAGDLIVTAGGSPVSSLDTLVAAIDAVADDGSLPVTVVRGAEEVTVEVSFARPEAAG